MNKAHRTLWLGFCFFCRCPVTFVAVTTLHYKRIPAGSPAYEDMLALRMRVLLDPIGIPRSYINPQKEAGDFLLGAYQDDALVACCILTPLSGRVVQLRQMAVDLPFQKKGTGAALLSFAESIAGQNGYTELVMHARDTVLPFYAKCGYRIAGEQFFEVGIAHHKMSKTLRPATV